MNWVGQPFLAHRTGLRFRPSLSNFNLHDAGKCEGAREGRKLLKMKYLRLEKGAVNDVAARLRLRRESLRWAPPDGVHFAKRTQRQDKVMRHD
jgi:hypothetical protein